MTLAFVLNLDAELELERYPKRYERTRAVRERVEALAREVRVANGAIVIGRTGQLPAPDAMPIAWSPTPSALATIREAGLAPPIAPDPSVLVRVNARPFAFRLAAGELPESVLAHDVDTARAALARPGAWLLKRCFGVSGRGQRPVRGGETSEADVAFVDASIRRHGAIVIEPRLTIVRELSVHAWVRGARTEVRSIRAPTVDRFGAFVASERARDLDAATERALVDRAEAVGTALAAAGYFGPFGIDAIVHTRGLRTLSEINARYCMGWDEDDGWTP